MQKGPEIVRGHQAGKKTALPPILIHAFFVDNRDGVKPLVCCSMLTLAETVLWNETERYGLQLGTGGEGSRN
jgi:hypothetical protein